MSDIKDVSKTPTSATAMLLQVHRNTFSAKINGKSKFFVEELRALRNAYFPELSLDALSEKKEIKKYQEQLKDKETDNEKSKQGEKENDNK